MLYYNTVNDLLKKALLQLMSVEAFNTFRLAGGTALSLQLGHRESIDIDLFSDVPYGNIDFNVIEHYLKTHFPYVDHLPKLDPGIGKFYFVGDDANNALKLDIFYTDPFIHAPVVKDNIRMATIEEIIAMKLDVIQRGGRKKDFWDIHELLESYPLEQMISLHKQRYPYGHDSELILKNFIDFSLADEDFDPNCLRGKFWEFIKDDISKVVIDYKQKL